MGYTTDFDGSVSVMPPLNPHEIAYLRKFAESRRMHRNNGPYYIGTGAFGQDREPDIIDYNEPPPPQPGLWCQWVPTDDGTAIIWDGGEKFYEADEWMRYIIDTFLRPGAALAEDLARPIPGRVYPDELIHFTFDHVLNGTIYAQGEDCDDRWRLVVTDNTVTTQLPQITWPS